MNSTTHHHPNNDWVRFTITVLIFLIGLFFLNQLRAQEQTGRVEIPIGSSLVFMDSSGSQPELYSIVPGMNEGEYGLLFYYEKNQKWYRHAYLGSLIESGSENENEYWEFLLKTLGDDDIPIYIYTRFTFKGEMIEYELTRYRREKGELVQFSHFGMILTVIWKT